MKIIAEEHVVKYLQDSCYMEEIPSSFASPCNLWDISVTNR